jgi:hypothetical protein
MQGYIRIWPMFAKDQCSYTIRFLRQEKSLRDHSCLDAPGHPHKTGNALNRAPSGWEEGSSAWAAGPSARAPGLALMADARRSVAGAVGPVALTADGSRRVGLLRLGSHGAPLGRAPDFPRLGAFQPAEPRKSSGRDRQAGAEPGPEPGPEPGAGEPGAPNGYGT